MNKIDFFIPVTFEGKIGFKERCLEVVDDYLSPLKEKAIVVDGSSTVFFIGKKPSLNFLNVVKIVSYLFIPLALSALLIKYALRSQHTFTLYQAEKELNRGVDLSQDTLQRVKQVLFKVIYRRSDDSIEILDSNLTFRFKEEPEFVFKFEDPDAEGGFFPPPKNRETIEKYRSMIRAKAISAAHKLDRIEVPHAKLFSVDLDRHTYSLIIERSGHVNSNLSKQIELLHRRASQLQEAFKQLVTFTAKSHRFYYTDHSNVFVVGEEKPRFAVMNLRDSKHACRKIPPLYPNGEIYQLVASKATQEGIDFLELKDFWQDYISLMEFYEGRGITDPKTPLAVDIDQLGLDLDQVISNESGSITIKEAVEETIKSINHQILEKSDQQGIHEIRLIKCEDSFSFIGFIGIVTFKKILQALKDKGCIYDYGFLANKNYILASKFRGYVGYFLIQA